MNFQTIQEYPTHLQRVTAQHTLWHVLANYSPGATGPQIAEVHMARKCSHTVL